ncbi:MAG: DEAD/DEAH box helicase [Marinobacterium sp.]|nr:DEAD/DEAH box helicase [Marinobacterium sp.]
MKFSSLDLAPDLLRALDACGYREMTPIQQKAIVPARRGRDLLANAQTGTGKTAAFALPIIQQMLDRPEPTQPGSTRALILTPTRELADQLAETISSYTQLLKLSVLAISGGSTLQSQQNRISKGVDLLIATPGRLLEHVSQCNIDLHNVEFIVLDEADRMLDMGFISDVMSLMQGTSEERQTLLFSATSSPAVNELAQKILNRPETIRMAKQNATADTVEHVVYPVEERRKPDLFAELLEENSWFQVLVFTSTKKQADELLMDLKIDGIKGAVCHGDKAQGARRRAIADFKSGKLQVLVATEVAARGLDIQGLEHVVNYNLPWLPEDYVHRIGRTGRAGQKGKAISFVSREEERALDAIEHLIGYRIRRINRPGYEVGSRDGLRKRVASSRGPQKRNKATRTQVKGGNSQISAGKRRKRSN